MRLSPRDLICDRRGVAMVEFALLAPVLCLLYFGVAELTQAVMAERRAAHTASAVGDLVAQSSSLASADVSQIFNLSNAILYPYPTQSLTMRVSSLVADARGHVTVAWSQASGEAQLAKGSSYTPPANVVGASQSVIMSEATYVYTSVLGYVLTNPITFSEKYYLRPRLSDQVVCSDC